ncbi:MAG: alpha-ketoglutarate-dependent dioxygenase AlkB [Myxococcales bacterium]|nr:alpha-ketoglutarate-dependent dioxygenase AlkB [Myxococcales bacterium]
MRGSPSQRDPRGAAARARARRDESQGGQLDLLSGARRGGPEPEPERWDLPDAELSLDRGFLPRDEADRLFAALRDEVAWRQDEVLVFGRRHAVPRLHQWYGEPGLVYRWSGIAMTPEPWTPAVAALRRRLEASVGVRFNSALINLYRDGRDCVGWHADDEAELGPRPRIASVSLGAGRDFVLRHRERRDLGTTKIHLTHGSLLVMGGATQEAWVHALPRRLRVREARINLTFRTIMAERSPVTTVS